MTDGDKIPSAKLRQRFLLVLSLGVAFILGALLFGGNDAASPHDHASDDRGSDSELWTCAMHPQIRSSEPGACPICAMDLVPVPQSSNALQDNPTRISLSESAKIRAKIQTTVVRHRKEHSGGMERRLLGRVDYDETRLRTVTSWIGGRIDKLSIRTTGQRVKRGQVIATLYSPEVFAAHQDLLVAKQQVQSLERGSKSAQSGAELALGASRDRLRLLGVPRSEISAMERAQSPSEKIRIRTPYAGTVIERLATEGSYVTTGMGLFQIADLSTLWVQLDAYESDLSLLHIGQEVALQVEALPDRRYSGRVTFVDPVLNQKTRTTRVRIEVKNPERELRPNMFVEAVVTSATNATPKPLPLVIPGTAPLFTGRRSVVYVEITDAQTPTYEARLVQLGPKMGDTYPVIAGVQEGERVVTHGAFTLDADLQIRGGRSMMAMPDDSSDRPIEQIVAVPSQHKAGLATVVQSYLSLHEALAADNLADAIAAAKNLQRGAESFTPKSPQQVTDAWMPLRRQLVVHSKYLVGTTSLDGARIPFRELSQQIATLLRIFGNTTEDTLRLAFCPMALQGEGAEWVQRASEIENPYFGAAMHACGEVNESVTRGTYLPSSQNGTESNPPVSPQGDNP